MKEKYVCILIVMSKKQINNSLCLCLIVLLFPIAAFAMDMADWRVPSKSELADDLSWRQDDTDLYLTAKADFDGDGKEDIAQLLINDKTNKMGLFVTLGNRKDTSPILLYTFDDKNWIKVMGVRVAKASTYKTACGKGYWDCKKDEPAELKLEHPAIDFFKFESANSFFVWDAKNNKFNRIWISD